MIKLLFLLLACFKSTSTAPVLTTTKNLVKIEVGTPTTTVDLLENYFNISSDLPAQKRIVKDTYQDQYNTLGNYVLIVQAINSKNQYSNEEKLIIQVQDTTPPTISLRDGGTTIISTTSLSDSEIKSLFEVADNYDQNIKPSQIEILKNTCNGLYNTHYWIQVQLTDSSHNKTIMNYSYFLVEKPYEGLRITEATPMPKDLLYTNEECKSQALHQDTPIQPDLFTYVHLVDIEKPLSLSQIQKRYQPFHQLSFQTNYSEQELSLGTYPLWVSYHTELYTITWKDEIIVREFHAPTITPKETELTIDLAQELDSEYFKTLFEVTDDIEIKEITFSKTPCGPDSFLLACHAIDTSTNETTAQILCHTFYSKKQKILPITLYVNKNTLTESEILSLFLAEYTLPTGYLNLDIQTNYFYNKGGIYRAVITTEFENEFQESYIFKINYQKQEQKKEGKILFYSSFAVLLILCVLLLFFYHKRSNSLR